MEYNRVFRITAEDIDRLREFVYDEPLVATYEAWLHQVGQLDALIEQIEQAFLGQKLGDGIGLFEADGIDYYATRVELAKRRAQDEKQDWRRIDAESLNACYTAPTFLDAHGFVFHLPAFLIAELNDRFNYGFIDSLIPRLIGPDPLAPGWTDLLTPLQRDSLIATLRLVAEHPDFHDRLDEIEQAINSLAAPRTDSKTPA